MFLERFPRLMAIGKKQVLGTLMKQVLDTLTIVFSFDTKCPAFICSSDFVCLLNCNECQHLENNVPEYNVPDV